ncbi:MAG: hypothetical protein SF182_30355 [Deltaproteobacteria bacterium]|nr:hypothetical protein [Deltaproteobacteria bacterium]
MPAARRRLVFMLGGLAAALVGVLLLGWLVNPFGVWPTRLIDRRYRSGEASTCSPYQRERVTMPYRMLAGQPTVLLLGSSRVQCGIAVPLDGADGFLNAALRGASLPELTDLLELAARDPALRRVIIGLDFYAFSAGFLAYQDPALPQRARDPLAHVWRDAVGEVRDGLLTTDSLVESARTLTRLARRAPKLPELHDAPWRPEEIRAGLTPATGLAELADDARRRGLAGIVAMYAGHRPADAAVIERFRAAIAALRARRIEVTPLVVPHSACDLAILRRLELWAEFVAWRRGLVELLGGYWDFSVSPIAAGEERLFVDTTHMRPAAGHAVLRRVLGLDCEGCGELAASLAASGRWLDARNVDAHLAADAATLAWLPGMRCAQQAEALRLP